MPKNGKALRKPMQMRKIREAGAEGAEWRRLAEARRKALGGKGLELAIAKAGGGSALGRAVGLSRQAISKWQWIPDEYLNRVGRVTGLALKQLRPDLF